MKSLLSALLIFAALLSSPVSPRAEDPFARRDYRLGAPLSQVAALSFPDESDWPGTKLFFSSEDTYVWAADSWLPLTSIRESMRPSWRNSTQFWVPIAEVTDVLPFDFTAEELQGTPVPYRLDKRHRVHWVTKERDLKKYADKLQYQHPPQAYLPRIYVGAPWNEADVVVGEFYRPTVDRTKRVDGKPMVHFSRSGLWLGDVWNSTTFYFLSPDASAEPVLFLIRTTGASEGFDRLKELLRIAHGEPTSVTTELVQNRLGATFQNEIVEYRRTESSLTLYKYTDELSEGILVHTYHPIYDALQERFENERKKAAARL